MGKGKTQFIKKYIEINQHKSILVISQRKSYTHFICEELKEYNIKSYLDCKKNDYEMHKSLCIQIESLHKINPDRKTYDLIILDEVETILNQFSSSTMVFINDNFETLEQLISNAKNTIIADAFITTRSIDYVKSIKTRRDNITMIKNIKPFLQDREAIQINGIDFKPNVLDAIANGKKIAIISTSRKDLMDIERAIYKDPRTQNKNIKYYDAYVNKKELKNVNESWAIADVVLYTPVITTGLSYDNELNTFDTVFINAKNTCQARDLMQMAMRIRKLNDNKIYFALSNKQMFNMHDIIFKNFEQFTNDIKLKGNEILKLITDDKLKDKINVCINTHNVKLSKVMYYNIKEQAISNKFYNQLCIYLLKKQGYKVVELIDKPIDEKNEKLEFDYIQEYSVIKTLDYTEVKELSNKELDKATKMSVDKYYFENMLIKDLLDDVKSKLFFDYYQNSYKKTILYNLRIEKSKR